jgi:hypothetical protein
MFRYAFPIVVMFSVAGSPGLLPAALPDGIIEQPVALSHGLVRGWMVQMDMDRARSRLRDLVLFEGTLYAQTDRGMIRAYDAETGKPLWDSARQVGNPSYPSSPPALGGNLLAVTNGSQLYVLNRFTGDPLWDRQIDGVPVATVGVSDLPDDPCIYVPLTSQMMEAYCLKAEGAYAKKSNKPKSKSTEPLEKVAPPNIKDLRLSQQQVPPLICPANGKATAVPLVMRRPGASEEQVLWPTDKGSLYIANRDPDTDTLGIKFRLETGGEIVAPASYLLPDPKLLTDPKAPKDFGLIYAVSRDGYVYAINDTTGASVWRFPAGEPLVQPAAVVDTNVYATTQLGGMHCLDAKTGTPKWWAPLAAQFIGASKERVYAADRYNHLLVLDARSGSRLDEMPIEGLPLRLFNTQTDRLYLASDTGLIQSLHEEGLPQPVLHGADRRKAPERAVETEEAKPEKPKPKPKPKPADGEKPKPKPKPKAKPAADDADNPKPKPKGKAKPKPGAATDNPFGTSKQ